jgi:hypothetical protein
VIEAKGTNGRVLFDGVLVTIRRGGARSWLRASGVRSIPARAITAVELEPAGLGRGWIRFEIDGDDELDDDDLLDDDYDEDEQDEDDDGGEDDDTEGTAARRSALVQVVGLGGRMVRAQRERRAARFDPAGDPNTVMFTRGHQRAFEDVRREVKTAMWQASQWVDDDADGDHTPTNPLSLHDPVRELRQLGQLLHDGVLDRTEFEQAKARLLDRI